MASVSVDMRFWVRMGVMLLGVFVVYVADAVLSYWVPGYLQSVLSSPLLMGLTMSFSSIIGLMVDLVFPQVVGGVRVRFLYVGAAVVGVAFAMLLGFSQVNPVMGLLLLAVGLWGIYYEFLTFANQQFVAESAEASQRVGLWGMLRGVKGAAYVIGPLLAGWLLGHGVERMIWAVVGLNVVGILGILVFHKRRTHMEFEFHEVNLMAEMEHWWALVHRVWPILLVSVMMGLVDATFWTTGAVLSESGAGEGWLKLWLPAYMLPMMLVPWVGMRWQIRKGKKRMAMKLLIVSGIVLSLLWVNMPWPVRLGLVLVSSVLSGLAQPLVDAVYTDLLVRMGRERKHLMGLSNSTFSLAYVVGPVVAGLVAGQVGELRTFALVGMMMAIGCGVLMWVMPKKLKLPQAEIGDWEREDRKKTHKK